MEVSGSSLIPVVRPQAHWPGVHAFCTTRAGGVGTAPYDTLNLGLGAGDDPLIVLENRRRLRALLPAEPVWLKQVHGTCVVDADVRRLETPEASKMLFTQACLPPEADAAVTGCPGRVLAILTADCLSVVMADTQGTVLGAAHAGWKGLAAGVLEATLAQMKYKQPLARQWRAWIGPGIGAASFQVGADVRDAFAAERAVQPRLFTADPLLPDKWRADLAGLARLRLEQMGVSQIELSGFCTVTDITHPPLSGAPYPTFFSYRRDRQTGRMATLAWLDPEA